MKNIYPLIFMCILVSGCSSYSPSKLGNIDHNKTDSKVIIIPFLEFNSSVLNAVSDDIEKKHKIKVSHYTNMGAKSSMYDKEKGQYFSDMIANQTFRLITDNGIEPCSKTVLVLTHKDINKSYSRLRYLFSEHFHSSCISVISSARINPASYGLPSDNQLTHKRFMKLINKALGFHLYKYQSATYKKSVMYGPILGPQTLDEVGAWY